MMKIGKKWMVGMLAAVMLTGCGSKPEIVEKDPQAIQQEIDFEALFKGMEAQEYMKGKWKLQEVQAPEYYRRIDRSAAELFEKEDAKDQIFSHDAKAGNNAFYSVYGEYNEAEERYDEVLAVFEYATGDSRTMKLPLIDGVTPYINRISASGDTLVLFRQASDEEGNLAGLYAHQWLGNDVSEGVDLYPAMEGYVEAPAAHFVLEFDCEYEAFDDRFYLISQEKDAIVTILRDGTRGPVYQEENAGFEFFVQTPEGLQLFESASHAGKDAEIFYLQDGEKKVLYQGTYIDSKAACIDAKGNIVYVDGYGRNLVEWRVCTGEQTKIFSAIGESMKYPHGIVREENGDIYVFNEMSLVGGMCHVVGAGPARKAVIRVRSANYMDNQIKRSLDLYATTHPGITFEYEEGGWDEREMYLNQIYSDIAGGEGADILVLSADQMRFLAEKECLADLQEMMPEDIREAIYPGVLQGGYVNDSLYLMPMTAYAESFYVKKSAWNSPTWNLDEFMDVVEAIDAEHPLKGAVCCSYAYLGPQSLLYYLCGDPEGEGFVNMQTGESFLNTEKFRRLLAFCKKYGNEEEVSTDPFRNGGLKEVEQGQCAVYLCTTNSFEEFSRAQAYLGEDYVLAGEPGCGYGTLRDGSGISVNKDSTYLDLIEDIVSALYSKEYALEDSSFTMPLRKDALEGRVRDATDWSRGKALFILDSRSSQDVEAKPDGTSYLKEYLEFLNCVQPLPKEAVLAPVRDIILEEAAPYFEGQKSLETVVEIMQSRVSLYVAEQR
ncbi:MAG: extracellular solute-binding protein [Acetatifactor sp.]|nr:extracellular solute-binding protein [Acetatifactor sp.]